MAEILRLDEIPCTTRTVINQTAFIAAFKVGLGEEMKSFPDRYPIIHISAHGSKHGIALSDGSFVEWRQLKQLLVPINESIQGMLLLCMSACSGYGACQMAMEEREEPHPYFAMVGNLSSPTWSETALAYLTFYHLLAKRQSIHTAFQAMAVASGNDNWAMESADESKKAYIEFLKSQTTPAEVQEHLEAAAEHEPPPAEAKALEEGAHQDPSPGSGETR